MPKMLFMRVKINTIIIFLVFIMDLMGYVKTLKPNSILVSNSIYIYIYRERERERVIIIAFIRKKFIYN